MSAEIKKEKEAMPEQDAKIRAKNFDEVALGYDEKLAVSESMRCLSCKNPACVDGCPVEIDIPAFIALLPDIRLNSVPSRLPAVSERQPEDFFKAGLPIIALVAAFPITESSKLLLLHVKPAGLKLFA